MAVPVHLFLTDDGGSVIRGSSDVQGREGSMELKGLHHGLTKDGNVLAHDAWNERPAV